METPAAVVDVAPEADSAFLALIILSTLILLVVGFMVNSCRQKRPSKSGSEQPKEIPFQFYTPEELRVFDGRDNGPVFVAIRGKVYDVSRRRDMYGIGGGYAMFAGRDASRALAKMSFSPEDLNSTDLTGLTMMETDTLNSWEMKYAQYPQVGEIVANQEEKAAKGQARAAATAAASASAPKL